MCISHGSAARTQSAEFICRGNLDGDHGSRDQAISRDRTRTKSSSELPSEVDTSVNISAADTLPYCQSQTETEVDRETTAGSFCVSRIVHRGGASRAGAPSSQAILRELSLPLSSETLAGALSQVCLSASHILCLQAAALLLATAPRRPDARHRDGRRRGHRRLAWWEERRGLWRAGGSRRLCALYLQAARQTPPLLNRRLSGR